MADLSNRLDDLAERLARFPAGQSVDVPAYLEEHDNPEAAERWREEHDKNKDNFKKTTGETRMAGTGDKQEYTEYFKGKMKEHGLDGIKGVDDTKLKKFYEDVDKGWKADKESSKSDIPGRLSSLVERIKGASKG